MASQDFEMWIGEDVEIDVSIVDEGANVINLTDCDLTWKVLAHPALTTKTIEKDNGLVGGILVTNYQGGTVRITIDKEDTLDMMPLGYDHELRLIKSTGDESVVLEGQVTLKRSITAK